MKYSYLALLALSLIPFSLSAETVLYACTVNGKTTLESTPPKQCDTLQEYHYPTYAKEAANANKEEKQQAGIGLRPEEIRQLEASSATPINSQARINRYENVDDRVGWSLANGYVDSRQEKCAFYRAELNNALYFIKTQNDQLIDIGPVRSAELAVQIQQGQSQVDYYCYH
jgi:hypothetical protein